MSKPPNKSPMGGKASGTRDNGRPIRVAHPDPTELLRQTAARYRVRVVGDATYDPNVGTSGVNWRDVLANKPPAPDWFRYQVRVTEGSWRLELRANDRFVAVAIRGDFGRVTPFSINRSDRVLGITRRASQRVGRKRWPVFSVGGRLPALLDPPNVRRAQEAFDLSRNESIHVYQNGVTVYVQPTSAKRLAEVIVSMVGLASQLPLSDRVSVDLSDLPGKLSLLVPLITTWADSDDVDRSARLGRSSSTRLQTLVRAVAPHFKSINTHLDSFRNRPMPESAAALGVLAECATEARLLLAARSRLPRAARQGLESAAAQRGRSTSR